MGNRVLPLFAAGALCAAGAVWFVNFEAAVYRRSLRELRESRATEAGRPPAPSNEGSVAVPSPVAMPVPLPVIVPADSDRSPGAKAEAPKVEAGPPAGAVIAADRAPTAAKPADRETPVKLPALVIPDLAKLPPAEVVRLGNVLHRLILANHGADQDSPLRRAITAATRPVVETEGRNNVTASISLLDSNEVNAFSHLGGHVYVTRGLFNMAATDEEFRFVVAHELAHLDLKHAQILVDEATRAGDLAGVGTLQALYHQIAVGYAEDQEFEADDRAIDTLLRLDHTRRECLTFLHKLVGLSEKEGFPDGRNPPRTGPAEPLQDVDNHFRSHPAARKRLERQEARFRSGHVPGAGAPAGRGR